jgi:hypothetical protein
MKVKGEYDRHMPAVRDCPDTVTGFSA